MTKRIVILAFLLVGACAGVLGLSKSQPQPFPHRAHVTKGVPCTRCHVGISEDDGSKLHIPDDTTCVECHQKPHDSRPCLGCHTTEGKLAELMEAREHLVFQHKAHFKEVKGNCARCHVGVAEGDTRMRPPMAACFKCHDQQAASNASRCDACHKDLEDSGTLPATHLAHDADWLSEHGLRAASSGELCQSCHKEAFCASCHGQTVAALPATMKFGNPFSPSVHRAGFASRHSLEAHSEPGTCTTCHQPERCATCHIAKGVAGDGRRSPHPPGWVGLTASENLHGREARRDPASCAACHDGGGQSLCIGCHKVGGVGGNPHPPGWSSRISLSSAPCRFCHPIGSRP